MTEMCRRVRWDESAWSLEARVKVCVFDSVIVLHAVLSGGVGEDGVRNGSLALTSL
jgi:hypothetical protein